jgi:hypothetical protein
MSEPAKPLDPPADEDVHTRNARINGRKAAPPMPRPPSPVTDAYFGCAVAGSFNFGGSPHATRDWSPRRNF